MARQFKALTAPTEDLGLVPRTYVAGHNDI